MSAKRRVLIIEDDADLMDKLRRIVGRAGHDVDVARTKPEALEKIRCRTYHAAMIDIMLSDDPSDRGGIECLEYLQQLDEGTAAVVLSATNDVRVPVEAWKKGAITYLVKKDIRSSEDILAPLDEALENCVLRVYGPFDQLTAYLAATSDPTSFEARLMIVLGKGIGGLYELLKSVFSPLLPVLRPKPPKSAITIDPPGHRVNATLWSKALGAPVWVSLGATGAEPAEPPEECRPVTTLHEVSAKDRRAKAKLWRITVSRDAFEESMGDSEE